MTNDVDSIPVKSPRVMKKSIHDMDDHEPEILNHEPVPGYRTVFHIAVTVASLYLIGIFVL
jgi:hypothetical protein